MPGINQQGLQMEKKSINNRFFWSGFILVLLFSIGAFVLKYNDFKMDVVKKMSKQHITPYWLSILYHLCRLASRRFYPQLTLTAKIIKISHGLLQLKRMTATMFTPVFLR